MSYRVITLDDLPIEIRKRYEGGKVCWVKADFNTADLSPTFVVCVEDGKRGDKWSKIGKDWSWQVVYF